MIGRFLLTHPEAAKRTVQLAFFVLLATALCVLNFHFRGLRAGSVSIPNWRGQVLPRLHWFPRSC